VGTFLLVFLLLAGGLVVIQAGTTQAEGKSIWGAVAECGALLVAPPAAVVTLVNVYTGEETSQPLAGGSYEFLDPAPGYYKVRAEAPGYFSAESSLYRFDGTIWVPVARLCLDPYPTKRNVAPAPQLWYNVTVAKSTPLTANENLTSAFTQTIVVSGEPATLANSRYASGSVNLVQAPVVSGSVTLMFVNASSGVPPRTLMIGVDYSYNSLWTGTMNILDLAIKGSMDSGYGRVNSNYTWSATQKNLQHGLVDGTPSVQKNGLPWPSGSNWNLNVDTGSFTVLGNFVFGADSLWVNYSYLDTITTATVEAWDTTYEESVASAMSTGGVARLGLWAGDFNVTISAPTYAARNYSLTMTMHNASREKLSNALTVLVSAKSIDNRPIQTGLVGVLYNQDPAVPRGARIVRGTSVGHQVTFRIPTGSYWLMVDADGYAADISTQTFMGDTPVDLVLSPSSEERVDTTITYTGTGWEAIRIARNVRLNADSVLAALDHTELRNTELQIDLAVGDGDGTLATTPVDERAAFQDWVNSVGPRYVTTQGFFTTNGVAYINTPLSYTATTSWVGGYLYINSTADYTRMGTTAIKPNLAKYTVNATTGLDTNTTVYVNNTFTVNLPNGYERTSANGDTVTEFTDVVIDPRTTGSSQANLVVEKSKVGAAVARVEGPETRFLELNNTVTNYTVAVAAGFNVIYTANGTTVGVGKAADANYTWKWDDTTANGYGIWTWHNFTGAAVRTVNLTVTQPNSDNKTYFVLKTKVDTLNPGASGTYNATGGMTNESAPVRFDGSASVDPTGITAPNNVGQVTEWFWDFDSDGTRDGVGKIVDHAYEKAGTYTPTLWTQDWVGHKSANFTLPVITVKDVTKPTISGWNTLRDITWTVATGAVDEDIKYYFDAGVVTDNVDVLANLTFVWTFEDDNGVNTTLTPPDASKPWNVTFTWMEPSTGQTLKLNVTDKAGNWAVFTKEQVVQVNLATHANVQVQDVKADPTTVEEGATTRVSVTVKHVGGNIAASNVRLVVKAVRGSATEEVTVTTEWFASDGTTAADSTIAKDGTKVAKFTYNVGGTLGNVRIEVRAQADAEPKTWIEESGKSVTVNVKAAGWKGLLVPILFVAILIGIPIAAIVYRKISSGEWELRRQRGEKDDEDEEEEADEDEEAPKKKKA